MVLCILSFGVYWGVLPGEGESQEDSLMHGEHCLTRDLYGPGAKHQEEMVMTYCPRGDRLERLGDIIRGI